MTEDELAISEAKRRVRWWKAGTIADIEAVHALLEILDEVNCREIISFLPVEFNCRNSAMGRWDADRR